MADASAWTLVTSFTGQPGTDGLVEFATRTYDPVSRVWLQAGLPPVWLTGFSGREGCGLVHDGFVLDGRQSAQAFLASATVVGPFDPGDDREAEASSDWWEQPARASIISPTPALATTQPMLRSRAPMTPPPVRVPVPRTTKPTRRSHPGRRSSHEVR